MQQKRTQDVREQALALFIDGENMAAHFAPAILAEAKKHGRVKLRRVYGDWSNAGLRPWQQALTQCGLRPVHTATPQKNAADIALTVDAMEAYFQGIRVYCLVSGDGDYTPLVHWLMEHGCFVLIIGPPVTPLTLQCAGSAFCSTAQFNTPVNRPAVPMPPIPQLRTRGDRRRSMKKRQPTQGLAPLSPGNNLPRSVEHKEREER